jgi:polysaccharide chain length determinant protein (PEP-CTERM system associated)
MKLLNFSDPKDYLALLVRRKRWILFPFCALSAAVLLFTYILPQMYVSEALVVIRPRDVPEDFVKDLIAGTTEQRLAAIQQTVLSRTILVQILNEFEDRLPEYRRLNMDEKVLKLRKQINVDFESERRGGVQLPVTYFRISYGNRNPELAQKVAAKVTSLFIDQDNRAREMQVYGTTEFLSSELTKISDQLTQSENRLQELRTRYRYQLPEQLDANLRALDRLTLQKQANEEAIDRFQTHRLTLERQITETPPTLPEVPRVTATGQNNLLIAEYTQKRTQLDNLTAKYTPNHPDVETLRIQLERLKEKIPAADLEALENPQEPAETKKAGPLPNPIYQNLTAQLQGVKTELELRERERKTIQEAMTTYSQRVFSAPQSQQEIGEVLRQNADLTKQYEKLKDDLAQARLSESLESRQKGSQFQIVDPANFPLVPTKPSKPIIAAVGLVICLFVGIAVAVIADIASQKVWTPSEVEALLGITVLAEIPEIVTPADIELIRRKRTRFIASSAAVFVVYTLCLYGIYVKQNFVLRQLDAVLQRFY